MFLIILKALLRQFKEEGFNNGFYSPGKSFQKVKKKFVQILNIWRAFRWTAAVRHRKEHKVRT